MEQQQASFQQENGVQHIETAPMPVIDSAPSDQPVQQVGAVSDSLAPGAVDAQRDTGVCKWFNTTKGFGFITPDNGGEDVFVHQTAIYARGFRSLAEGERVEYNVVVEGNRSKATEVTGPNGNFVQGAPQQRPNGGFQHRGDSGRGRNAGSGVSCYSCGQLGHFSRNCHNTVPVGNGFQGYVPNAVPFASYAPPAVGFQQQPAASNPGFSGHPMPMYSPQQYQGGFNPPQFDATGYPGTY